MATDLRILRARDPAFVVAHAAQLSALDAVIVESGARGNGDNGRAAARRILFAAGFLPLRKSLDESAPADSLSYMRSSLIDDVRLAGASDNGAVSMTNLGNRGRLGNQIFQYGFLKLYALRNHADVKLPPWREGSEVFAIHEPRATLNEYPDILFEPLDDDDLALWDASEAPVNVNFSGYFHEVPESWLQHRAFLRRLFALRGDWEECLSRILARAEGRTLVTVHIRRGDYADQDHERYPHMRPIPVEWQVEFVRAIWPTLNNPVLHVATDGGKVVTDLFKEWPALDTEGCPDVPPEILDFFLLREADVMSITNSSFSRAAALLAKDGQRCFIPSLSEKKLVPYEVWEDRHFWARFSPPADIQARRLFDARLRGVAARHALGMAHHRSPSGRLVQVSDTAPAPCKICAGVAPLFGVLDFSEWGGGRQSQISGRPVYYRRCDTCGLVFTTLFDNWSTDEFQGILYNEEFMVTDPAFVMQRPVERAEALADRFPERADISVFDFGAANFMTAETLKGAGFAEVGRFDLFDSTAQDLGGGYDIVSCFDILERTPEPRELSALLASCAKDTGVIVFTATTKAEDAKTTSDCDLGPRRGQMQSFSTAALERLWQTHGFQTRSLGDDWHIAFRQLPRFAMHLVTGKD